MMKMEIMTLKVEPDLKRDFQELAAKHHRPASQLLRELMRAYICSSEHATSEHIPNELTAQTIRLAREGKDVFRAKDIDDLRSQLDI